MLLLFTKFVILFYAFRGKVCQRKQSFLVGEQVRLTVLVLGFVYIHPYGMSEHILSINTSIRSLLSIWLVFPPIFEFHFLTNFFQESKIFFPLQTTSLK